VHDKPINLDVEWLDIVDDHSNASNKKMKWDELLGSADQVGAVNQPHRMQWVSYAGTGVVSARTR
jgi:hypothetical protein